MNRWMGISIGDVGGIGPEVTLKAVANELAADSMRYLLIGSNGCLRRLAAQLGLDLDLLEFQDYGQPGRVFIWDPPPDLLSDPKDQGSAESANAALAWLRDGASRCLKGELDALVTAPVNKAAILRAGHEFVGQTEYLSDLAATRRTAMMLLGSDDRGRWLRVVVATTHVPLARVPAALTREKIDIAIECAASACKALRLPRSRVGVCGLNPHAGEGGLLGTEEEDLIRPAIHAAVRQGLDVAGPFAADTLFHRAYHGGFDAVVAMYHDQGLVPLKLIGFDTGVNWTLGLPFVRTSPDHGTAYDIAGQGIADSSSMREAIRLARQLARERP